MFMLMLTILPRLTATTSATTDATTSAATGAATGAPTGETLLLEVQVNSHSIGEIGEFTLYRGTLMARPDELRDLGFRVPDTRTSGPGGLIALSDLPGLTWSLDLKKQELYVTASNDRLLPMLLQPNGRERPESRRVIESGTGVTLNYDAVGSFASGRTSATGSLDLRSCRSLAGL
jgi:outer membrane usher protein